ncbi:MAG: YceI family protein [Proteobacteria bacterium]|nr:YceI family protein [Pseudomonadota bacterium]
MNRHWPRAFGVLVLAAATGTAGAAPTYTVVPAQSSLSFIGTQQGEKFTGVIRDFDARIAFGTADLAGSRLEVAMRLKSIDSKSPDRDQAIATTDWFDVAKYPVATFRTLAIRATPTGAVGDAELTIKGHTQRLAFPFAWKAAADGGATLDARVTLDRLDFGLGTGEWADESMVGRKVEVVVHLTLAPAAPPPAAPGKPPVAKPAHP